MSVTTQVADAALQGRPAQARVAHASAEDALLCSPMSEMRVRRHLLLPLLLSLTAHGGLVLWVDPLDTMAPVTSTLQVALVPTPAAPAVEPVTLRAPVPEPAPDPQPAAVISAPEPVPSRPPAAEPVAQPPEPVRPEPREPAEPPLRLTEAQPKVEPKPAPKPETKPQPEPQSRPAPSEIDQQPPAAVPVRPDTRSETATRPEARPQERSEIARLETTRAAAQAAAQEAKQRYLERVQGWVERHKRYPRMAQRLRQEGTALLRFTLDREGRVVDYRIEQSSGHAALDGAVEDLVGNAAPFPEIPGDLTLNQIELVVPVSFRLAGG